MPFRVLKLKLYFSSLFSFLVNIRECPLGY